MHIEEFRYQDERTCIILVEDFSDRDSSSFGSKFTSEN